MSMAFSVKDLLARTGHRPSISGPGAGEHGHENLEPEVLFVAQAAGATMDRADLGA
jgi:hypothetical protein